MEVVLHREQIALILVERVPDYRFVPVRAENNSYRRIVAGIHHFAFVVMLVELHLPDVLRRHLPNFKVNQDKAPGNEVVEQEIEIPIIMIIEI